VSKVDYEVRDRDHIIIVNVEWTRIGMRRQIAGVKIIPERNHLALKYPLLGRNRNGQPVAVVMVALAAAVIDVKALESKHVRMHSQNSLLLLCSTTAIIARIGALALTPNGDPAHAGSLYFPANRE
jgi:hypothetical protein